MADIYTDYDIKNHTTFKIGGKVKKVAFPSSIKELVELLSTDEYDYILGNCSNVLFSSDNTNKSIIITKKIEEYNIEGNIIKVSCGTKGPIIANECKKRSLTGFEFLIGFPGSFGGMIYMNASAHNQYISDTFKKAIIYDISNKKIIETDKETMEFGYRKSILTERKYVLLEAEFELKEGEESQINEIMGRNIEFRKTRQPSLKYGNAGSIFKNPENDSAGRLLDLCNMKGEKEGGAVVFKNHANFIINKENATSEDVLKLMYKMYSKVKEKYTIELRPEIKYIGDEGTKEYKLWEIMNQGNMTKIQK